MSVRIYAILFGFLSCQVFVSCDDPLPDYHRPENVFIAGFSSPDTIVATYSGVADFPPSYAYNTPAYEFILWVENVFDETLQANADIHGTLELSVLSDPSRKVTMTLSNDAVSGLNSSAVLSSNILTLNPHQKLYLGKRWNYQMDDGYWINEVLTSSVNVGDGITTTAQLRARISVSLFKNTAVVVADKIVTLELVGSVHYRP
jgi:hypothetical protein